jgi:hypothetical protein
VRFDLGGDKGARLGRLEALREKLLVARGVVADVGADGQHDRLRLEGLGRRRATHPPAVLGAGVLRDGLGLGAWAAWEECEHALGEADEVLLLGARLPRPAPGTGRFPPGRVCRALFLGALERRPCDTSIPWRSCRLRARENFTTVTARDKWAPARRVSAGSLAGR